MRNQTIRDRFAALTVLSQRVLPGTTAIAKVEALLRRFGPAYEVTEKRRKQVIQEFPVPETWERVELPAAIAEKRTVAMDRAMEEAQFIKKVSEHLRLTDADMPVTLKREGGSDNVAGLAHVKRLLGSLYKPTTPEEQRLAEDTAGEEEEGEEYSAPTMDPRRVTE